MVLRLLCRMARTLHSGNKRTHTNTHTPLYLIVSSQQLNHKFIVARCSEIVYFLILIFLIFKKSRKNKVH